MLGLIFTGVEQRVHNWLHLDRPHLQTWALPTSITQGSGRTSLSGPWRTPRSFYRPHYTLNNIWPLLSLSTGHPVFLSGGWNNFDYFGRTGSASCLINRGPASPGTSPITRWCQGKCTEMAALLLNLRSKKLIKDHIVQPLWSWLESVIHEWFINASYLTCPQWNELNDNSEESRTLRSQPSTVVQ